MSATRDMWVAAFDEKHAIGIAKHLPSDHVKIGTCEAFSTKEAAERFISRNELSDVFADIVRVRLTVVDETAPDPLDEIRRHVENRPGVVVGTALDAWMDRLVELTGAKL